MAIAASNRQRLLFIEAGAHPEDFRNHENDQAVQDRQDIQIRTSIETQPVGDECVMA
jgi:hypothetical protein